MTLPGFREYGKKYSNWGRWGTEDELGTLNFITEDCRRHAASLVKTGKTFSLCIPLDSNGPQLQDGGRINPIHWMTQTGQNQPGGKSFQYADDWITMPLQAATQLDALSHAFYDDITYNGRPALETVLIDGAHKNSITATVDRIIGRGVLLDLPRALGMAQLPPSYCIQPHEFDETAKKQGVEIRSGDLLVIRTGWMAGKWDDIPSLRGVFTEPGPGLESIEWLHAKEIAAIFVDNIAVEVVPSQDPESVLPLHCVLIRDLGMTLGEWFWLEDLADDCAADGQYEFLLSAAPLRVTKAVGSPVNPIALK